MSALPFIDIHSHRRHTDKYTIQVINLFPGDSIPVFNGKIFYSMGLHPWRLQTREENIQLLSIIEEAQEFDHVIFIGECGLDKVYGGDMEEQKRVFSAQAMIAEEYQKPLLIHCVRAYNEIIELFNQLKPSVPWIIHGFTGSFEIAQQMVNKGFMFSFGKILLKSNAKAIEAFRILPLQTIFLETDEYEGALSDIYNVAAEIKGISVENLNKAVWENFNRLENVSLPGIKNGN